MFNFANVIVVPLLLGSGVEGIYLIHRFRTDPPPSGNMLETSTARALLFSTLTTILSFLVLGYVSTEFVLANLLIGTIIPTFVAPLAINLFKQVNAIERANLKLSSENMDIKRLERETGQKARDMQAVNELAIECAAATPDTDIFKLIAEKLRDITNALGVGITVYIPAGGAVQARICCPWRWPLGRA